MTIYPYLDRALSVDQRVDDLLRRLPLRRKAALMFHTILPAASLDSKPPILDMPTGRECIAMGISHYNVLGCFKTARMYAEFTNEVQKLAMTQDLAIPITFSSDPRHAFDDNPAVAMIAGVFSQWPEHLGMAAIGDEDRLAQQADIVRQEYLAVGFRAALHPQIDLATEYRWSRIMGGLGEDADLASRLAAAEIRALHGPDGKIGPLSITTCVKHFPGGAPARDGLDPHFAWGTDVIYPGDNFAYHLLPFRAAVDAGVRAVMPSYARPVGIEFEPVAWAFNKPALSGLLRGELGFEGVILSDWNVITDNDDEDGTVGDVAVAKAWGVEHLSREERLARAIDAGVDQFGGEYCVDLVVKVVEDGLISEERIDESARRLLREKFLLGLFDNPYVDADAAGDVVGRVDFVDAGFQAQKDSLTLLTNRSGILPLARGFRLYTEGFTAGEVGEYGSIVSQPEAADIALVRLHAPFETVGRGAFAAYFHHGSLEFPPAITAHIAKLASHCPVIVDVKADRPLVLGPLVGSASAIIINYGSSDRALLEVLFGQGGPMGKLPFDLPRSNAAVAASRADVPFDTEDPVFRFGFGLRY